MKVCLVYHEAAGEGLPVAVVKRYLSRFGYEVVLEAEQMPGSGTIREHDVELVVVAGGDGTISRAAALWQHQDVPLALLPLGTANNIANTLGIEGSLSGIIARWSRENYVHIDIGHVAGATPARHFVEGVGGGLVAKGIAGMDAAGETEELGRADRIKRAIRYYRRALATLEPRATELIVDGTLVRTNALLVEVLNTQAVGSGLVLGWDAHMEDGFFTVVHAGPEHRKRLDDYLRARLDADETTPQPALDLPALRARTVKMLGWDGIHIDDEVRTCKPEDGIVMNIQPGAVRLLA